jgi:hypothetical protein
MSCRWHYRVTGEIVRRGDRILGRTLDLLQGTYAHLGVSEF